VARAVAPRAASAALTWAAGLAAAVPVIAATVKAVRAGWVPGADQAIIATRAYDVFTSHSPLVGQYTLAGNVTGQVTHSLGPLLFWLLALPAHFSGPIAMTVTMGAVNTLAIVGSVALARRRGGLVLMFASAVAIALMCQSLAAETFHDVWNPSAGLFPFLLLIFVSWSLACGDYRLLPLAALLASFVVQAHLMYLPPTVGLALVALGGLALTLRQRRRADAGGGPRRRSLLAWAGAALVVLMLCWSAPVVDELRGNPGNMTLVVRSATSRRATLGASVGWHAVVRAVGVRPWWLYVPSERWSRKYDVRGRPSSSETGSAVALLALLAVTLVVAIVRRRRDVAAGALIGFVLCGALAAVAASTPTPRLLSATLGYTMWWGSHLGMWVWLMLAWSAWLALAWLARALAARVAWRPLRRAAGPPREAFASGRAGAANGAGEPGFGNAPLESGRPPGGEAPLTAAEPGAAGAAATPRGAGAAWRRRSRPAASLVGTIAACLAAVAGTAGVGAAVASTERPDEHQPLYRPTARLAAKLVRVIPPGSSVEMLGTLGIATMPIKPSLRYYLVRHGVRPLAPGSFLRLGDWYELRNRPYQYIVEVREGVHSPAAGLRLLDRVHITDGFGRQTVSLWYGPHIATAAGRPARRRAPHSRAAKP